MKLHSVLLACFVLGCGDGNAANRLGVGAQCSSDTNCLTGERCLPFKGGYCGLKGCIHDSDCPGGSACVMHTDGMNYCFLICVQKPDCNAHRDAVNEANCSSSAVLVDGAMGRKVCVPPNG
jgi:hypothetical protein